MLKFLLTILLISTAVKIVSANGLFVHNNAIEKTYFEDEEDGNEKAEKKQSQKAADDNFMSEYHFYNKTAGIGESSPIPLRPHKAYYSFIDQPNTPPPDAV